MERLKALSILFIAVGTRFSEICREVTHVRDFASKHEFSSNLLVLLRHKIRVDLVQHGHRIKRRVSVTVSVLRSVAIDVEVCRSGRIGGFAGLRTAGNCRFFAVLGRGTS